VAEFTLAIRGLLRSPAHTCLVIVCLAIGLAVNIVSFSVAHAVIYGDLPGITTRHTIVRLSLQYDGVFGAESVNGQRVYAGPLTRTDFQALTSAPPSSLTRVAAEGRRSVRLRVGQDDTSSRAAFVSPDYFETLGTTTSHGRLLRPDDHRATAPPVVVVSHHLWTERFGASGEVTGQFIEIEGRMYTIVGVAPPRFSGMQLVDVGQSPRSGTQVWIPLIHDRTNVDAAWLDVFGRKADDVTLTAVEDTLAPVGARIQAASPGQRSQARLIVRSFGIDPAERPMAAVLGVLLFMAVPLCVMGIALANVINLQLARVGEHTRAVLVRLSLGATRLQAMRWLLWETMWLGGIAALAGLVLARAATQLGAHLLPFELSPNTTVIFSTLAFTTVIVLLSTWIPARLTMRGLTLTGGWTSTPRHWRLRHILVVVQVAVSVALVLIAALSVRSIAAVADTAPPDANRVQFTQITIPDAVSPADRHVLTDRLLADVLTQPSVVAAGVSSASGLGDALRYWHADDELAVRRSVAGAAVTPGWFDAMGATPFAGRMYTSTETGVAVISEAMAQRLASSPTAAIGLSLRVQLQADAAPQRVDIVGVFADPIRSADGSLRASLYVASSRHGSTLVTRQRTDTPMASQLEQWAHTVDSRITLQPMNTLEGAVAGQAVGGFVVGAAFGGIGALAAVLAFLGLVAIMSFMVQVRSRELAIRGALGARPADLVRLVLRLSTRLVLVGAAVGLSLGVALAIAMRSQLVGISALDPLSVLTTISLFVVIGTLAAAWPAVRAAGTNPALLLRSS
jgi:putative ABC transport system permease protein